MAMAYIMGAIGLLAILGGLVFSPQIGAPLAFVVAGTGLWIGAAVDIAKIEIIKALKREP